jgi:2-polyprenyl-3-methyl-5-hydroxy-6-metoxy-1,4-benzoquinol methylase
MSEQQNPGSLAGEPLSELKQRMKASWMAGDFGQIAKRLANGAEDFIARLNLQPGMKVLDVGCGTGNQSLPAARTGATVTGVDISTNLLEQARQRAAGENLKIQFDEGDAEQLPYGDAQFDVVLSMFGAMFAPRPEYVVSEFKRVCKPGGLIAMANWTPDGFVGQSFRVTGRHAPPPPSVLPPVLWGSEEVVRQRFGSEVQLEMNKRTVLFDLPDTTAESVVDFFREYFGPTKVAFSRLDAEGQQRMRDDLIAHWRSCNVGDAKHIQVHAEYLEVHARLPGRSG